MSNEIMNEKHPGPLVVEGKLTDAERLKKKVISCAAPLPKI